MAGAIQWSSIRTVGGNRLDETLSAIQKEIRRGNYESAREFVLDMFCSRKEGHVIGKLRTIVSEDVGVASADMPQVVASLLDRIERIRNPPKTHAPKRPISGKAASRPRARGTPMQRRCPKPPPTSQQRRPLPREQAGSPPPHSPTEEPRRVAIEATRRQKGDAAPREVIELVLECVSRLCASPKSMLAGNAVTVFYDHRCDSRASMGMPAGDIDFTPEEVAVLRSRAMHFLDPARDPLDDLQVPVGCLAFALESLDEREALYWCAEIDSLDVRCAPRVQGSRAIRAQRPGYIAWDVITTFAKRCEPARRQPPPSSPTPPTPPPPPPGDAGSRTLESPSTTEGERAGDDKSAGPGTERERERERLLRSLRALRDFYTERGKAWPRSHERSASIQLVHGLLRTLRFARGDPAGEITSSAAISVQRLLPYDVANEAEGEGEEGCAFGGRGSVGRSGPRLYPLGPPRIPDYAVDAATARGRDMGRGVDHLFEEGHWLERCTIDDPYRDPAYRLEKEAEEYQREAVAAVAMVDFDPPNGFPAGGDGLHGGSGAPGGESDGSEGRARGCRNAEGARIGGPADSGRGRERMSPEKTRKRPAEPGTHGEGMAATLPRKRQAVGLAGDGYDRAAGHRCGPYTSPEGGGPAGPFAEGGDGGDLSAEDGHDWLPSEHHDVAASWDDETLRWERCAEAGDGHGCEDESDYGNQTARSTESGVPTLSEGLGIQVGCPL